MRFLQHLEVTLFLLVLCLSSFSFSEENGGVCDGGNCAQQERKQIAIIGGGIAGSSAAYYIAQLLPEVDITIYEKEQGVCGRLQDTLINGHHVEVGGSIYHASNTNVDGFVSLFNLTRTTPFGGATLGIWNGKEFVFKESSLPFIGNYIDVARMFYRYGMSPYNLKNYLDSLMGNWSKLYTQNEPFNTVDEFFDRLGLKDEATTRAPEHLEQFGISREFTNEILGAMTRVNYNTDVNIMNSFGVAVSAIGSGSDIFGVKEGNKKICEKLANAANANSKYGHTVTFITRERGDEVKYTVETNNTEKTTYDAVVIAVPLELAKITFNDQEIQKYSHERVYQEVYITFVAGELNPEYFKINETVPSVILTIESSSIPFSSIGRSKNITTEDGRPVSKVFSREPLADETVENVFLHGSVVYQTMIHAYPVLRPPTKFVPVKLAKNMYYVNSMESVVSTIETETISAKNIARLLAKDWGYEYDKKL